jgi:hypothetical protein
MEETCHFVSEFKPELFGAKLEEATAERKLHEHGGGEARCREEEGAGGGIGNARAATNTRRTGKQSR